MLANRAGLGYYAACRCSSLARFRENLSVPTSGVKNQDSKPQNEYSVWDLGSGSNRQLEILDPSTWTDRLSRSVGKDLPLNADL